MAEPGARPATTAFLWVQLSCRPRAGRDVRGPTCGGGSAGSNSRRGSWPASKAPRWRASFRPGRSSSAMAAPSVKPGARRRGRRGARRPAGTVQCAPRDGPEASRESRARRPSGRDPCVRSRWSGTGRAREVRRGGGGGGDAPCGPLECMARYAGSKGPCRATRGLPGRERPWRSKHDRRQRVGRQHRRGGLS